MANKKFSEFTLKTDSANVDFVVGYDGTDNVRIAPSNLGGGGASDLNGLSDCLVDTASLYVGQVPSSLSGNPQNNTTIGINAGAALTTGVSNTLLGTESGETITTGQRNILIGHQAGHNINNSLVDYIGIGYQAGHSASSGNNIAIGREAGRANTGNGSINVGYKSGFSNTSGQHNLNVGYFAGWSNTTGGFNVKVGTEAGIYNTGSNNTFVGYKASEGAFGSSTGSNNTSLGFEAGRNITTGSQNSIIGYQAGDNLTTGSNNILIGYDATASSVSVSNEITLGDANITALRCQVQTISALSDNRDKTNVQPSTYGLDFINKLNPVTFDWDMRDGAKVGDKDLGFIAQELQEVDDENLQLVYANNPDRLEASYGRLIPVLVKAIQELKLELDNCKNCK